MTDIPLFLLVDHHFSPRMFSKFPQDFLQNIGPLEDAACKFTGEHFMSMVKTNRDYLLKVPTDLLTQVLQPLGSLGRGAMARDDS